MQRGLGWALAIAAAALGIGGCTMFFGGDERHVVGESQLNWMEIRYVPATGKPGTILSLLGVGQVHIKRGASPQVMIDFSVDTSHAAWNDVKSDQITLTPAEMRNIFQAFADRGVFGEPSPDFVAAAERGGPFARIRGRLDTETVARYAVEPELIDLIRAIERMFDEAPRGGGSK